MKLSLQVKTPYQVRPQYSYKTTLSLFNLYFSPSFINLSQNVTPNIASSKSSLLFPYIYHSCTKLDSSCSKKSEDANYGLSDMAQRDTERIPHKGYPEAIYWTVTLSPLLIFFGFSRPRLISTRPFYTKTQGKHLKLFLLHDFLISLSFVIIVNSRVIYNYIYLKCLGNLKVESYKIVNLGKVVKCTFYTKKQAKKTRKTKGSI